jgi:hypothetical protein
MSTVHSATTSILAAVKGGNADRSIALPREKPAAIGVRKRWHVSRNGGKRTPGSHEEPAMAMPSFPSPRDLEASCCLLVMESGSRWPAWLDAPPESRIVAQNADESIGEFASRVVRSIRAIRGTGRKLEQVVIAAGWVTDEEQALFARCLITQAAARAMDASGGTVALSGHDRLPESSRHELFATAGALAQQLAGSPIEVSVRFDSARSGPRGTSGIYSQADAPVANDAYEHDALPLAEPVLITS